VISKLSKSVNLSIIYPILLLLVISCSETNKPTSETPSEAFGADSLQKGSDPETEKAAENSGEGESKTVENEYCIEIKEKLSAASKDSPEYNDLLDLYKKKCSKDSGQDSESYCADLKEKLSTVSKDSPEYNDLLDLYKKKCSKDSGQGSESYCAGLKKKMSAAEKETPEYKKLLELFNAKCFSKSDVK